MEIEEIVGNLTSNHRRIGIICGAQGMGKTTLAVQVGHMLLSKGWHVYYHLSNDQDASLKILPRLTAHAISGILRPTLFILDNLDTYNEPDGQDKMYNVLQTLVESVTENGYLGLLFVTRCKHIPFLSKIPFLINLQPLGGNFAVELLNNPYRNIPVGDLKAIAEVCDHSPLALMVARRLIENGVAETDIINEMSSFDKLPMGKVDKLENSHFAKGEESLSVSSYSWHLLSHAY